MAIDTTNAILQYYCVTYCFIFKLFHERLAYSHSIVAGGLPLMS